MKSEFLSSSTQSSPEVYLQESRAIKQKRFTHHWTIVGAGSSHHRLRWPALWFCLIFRRVPLHASVMTRQNLISFYYIVKYKVRLTYFMDEEALLLMVKFSASDASELSKSPVSTLPGCCDWTAPGIICGCVAWNEPADMFAVPADPTGFSTSPNGSKPFMFSCLVKECLCVRVNMFSFVIVFFQNAVRVKKKIFVVNQTWRIFQEKLCNDFVIFFFVFFAFTKKEKW